MNGNKTRAAAWAALALVAIVATAGSVAAVWLFQTQAALPPPNEEIEALAESLREDAETQEKPGELLRLPKRDSENVVLPKDVGPGWPTLLGPNHDCTSPERGLNLQWPEAGPYEKWRIPVGTGYGGPVVWQDKLVLLHRKDNREIVECFDAESGQSRWSFDWPATYKCPFAHSSGPYSSPVLEEGRVWAIGAEGHCYCLNLDDGQEFWHRDLHADYQVEIEVWPVAASPLLEGNRLIVNVGGRKTKAGIIALDKQTGETLWQATSDGASCSTPRAATIHGRRVVIVWTADALVSLAPSDGTVFWRIPFCANNYEAAHGTPPLIADDIVLVSGYQLGNLCVRVLPDGGYQELWRDKRKLLDSQYNNLLHLDGRVCGFSAVWRSFRCLDLKTGELQWKWRSRIRTGTTIAVDGGYLMFGANGRLASLRISSDAAEEVCMTRRPVLRSPSLSYPALHNGLLYLRNEEELLCIDLRRANE